MKHFYLFPMFRHCLTSWLPEQSQQISLDQVMVGLARLIKQLFDKLLVLFLACIFQDEHCINHIFIYVVTIDLNRSTLARNDL